MVLFDFRSTTLFHDHRSKRIPFDMSDSDIILKVKNLSKTYLSAGRELTVLREASFEVKRGAAESIVGPSGSGKTTLLGLCAGLDEASSGSVILNDVELTGLDEDGKAALRNRWVGFVFQNFQLIPTLTALENVMVPIELGGGNDASDRAADLLSRVGLSDRSGHYPVQLSGGELQRVALARAFVNEPRILFVDEPTGNLDTANSEQVAELLFELNREKGTTLILVTHDTELAGRTDRVLRIADGVLEPVEAKPRSNSERGQAQQS